MKERNSSSKSGQTKQKLYLVARRQFQQKGYETTTMRAIADEAKLALGSAYYYFKSKEEFLIQLYSEFLEELQQKIEPMIIKARSPRRKLEIILENFLDLLIESRNLALPLLQIKNQKARQVIQQMTTEKLAQAFEKDVPIQRLTLTWFYTLGLFYYWSKDESAEQKETRKFLSLSFPFFFRLLNLSRAGIGRRLINQIVKFNST